MRKSFGVRGLQVVGAWEAVEGVLLMMEDGYLEEVEVLDSGVGAEGVGAVGIGFSCSASSLASGTSPAAWCMCSAIACTWLVRS